MSPKGRPCRPCPGLSICSESPLLFRRSCRCWRGQRLPPAKNAIVSSSDLSRNSVVKREGKWLPSAKSRLGTVSTITAREHPLSSHLHQNPGRYHSKSVKDVVEVE